MHHRNWLRALAIAPCLTAVLAAQDSVPQAAEAPQVGLVKVAPHGSRWDYPKEVNVQEGTQLHVVEKGDTLWDLSAKYLGNPYAWPQIWELNQWVKDPHWIYPGDPIVIDLGKAVATQGSVPDEVTQLQPDRPRFDASALRRPELAYSFQDFLQLPYLVADADAHYRSLGAFELVDRKEETRHFLGEGETVFLNGGTNQGVKAGDRFVVLQTARKELEHPTRETKHPLGDVVQQIGLVRVTQADANGSSAVVERAMDPVQVGDHVARFTEPANIPLQLRTDIQEPVKIDAQGSATVVYARDHRQFLSNGDLVIIDKGADAGFKVGDVLLVVRTKTIGLNPDARPKDRKEDSTTFYIGQAMVVRADGNTATCRVLRSSVDLVPGDIVTR